MKFKKSVLTTIILLTIFIACSDEKESTLKPTSLNTFKPLNISEYVESELLMNSSDISPCCCVSISETLFPNKKKYPLSTPMEFFSVDNSGFHLNKRYYYSSSDSIVRVILYDWTFPRHWLLSPENRRARKSRSKKLYKKYKSIILGLKEKFGNPTSMEIVDEYYYRESHLWNRVEQPKAYVFILGNKDKEFYRLRLATYE